MLEKGLVTPPYLISSEVPSDSGGWPDVVNIIILEIEENNKVMASSSEIGAAAFELVKHLAMIA